MSDAVRRVRMVTPDGHRGVFDGFGGTHMPGDTPVLPVDVAALFIERGLAVPFGADAETTAEQRRELDWQTRLRDAEAAAKHARARMAVHDSHRKPERVAAAEREDLTHTHTGAVMRHAYVSGLYTTDQLRADIERFIAGTPPGTPLPVPAPAGAKRAARAEPGRKRPRRYDAA